MTTTKNDATQAPTIDEARAIVRDALIATATGKETGKAAGDRVAAAVKATKKDPQPVAAPKGKATKKAPSGPQAATKGKRDPKAAPTAKKAAGAKDGAAAKAKGKAAGKKDPKAKAGKPAAVGKGKTIVATVTTLKKDGAPKKTNLGMTFPAGKLTQKDRTYRVYLTLPAEDRTAGNAVAAARKARVSVSEATAKTWFCWWNNGRQIPRYSRDLKDPQARQMKARAKAKA